jgi:hypothetical protein
LFSEDPLLPLPVREEDAAFVCAAPVAEMSQLPLLLSLAVRLSESDPSRTVVGGGRGVEFDGDNRGTKPKSYKKVNGLSIKIPMKFGTWTVNVQGVRIVQGTNLLISIELPLLIHRNATVIGIVCEPRLDMSLPILLITSGVAIVNKIHPLLLTILVGVE